MSAMLTFSERMCAPSRDKRRKGAMCEFLETVEARGYSRYRSIANATHFLAFNAKGKPLRYNPRLSMGYEENCINFVKIDVSFNITRHNSKISGGSNHIPDVARWYYKQGSTHSRRHKGKRRKA
ncbi:hypothetical protein RUM43_007376 [Polyplax serrata]|uniref:Uncharacterized protein n=1 Tax=Polyplax serrata TaxID=468196 RepID=A0AAN8SA62_POLSC